MGPMNDAIDYEVQYNSRLAIPGHAKFSDAWDVHARDYRAGAAAELDIPYGPGERTRFDFFPGRGADGAEPLAVYIHGGYWRSRGRETFSHVARPLNERGISVAIPSYDHCPTVTIMEIIAQMRGFLAKLWERTGQHPVIAGHSAGGHLTACMFATDWSGVDGVPDDLVRCAYAVSGIYDLTPVRKTSVNEDLGLSEEGAREASPFCWPAPARDREFVAAVGGQESDEFKRQSRDLIGRWRSEGVNAEFAEIPGGHHFSIVDALTAPGSPMMERVADMAEAAARG